MARGEVLAALVVAVLVGACGGDADQGSGPAGDVPASGSVAPGGMITGGAPAPAPAPPTVPGAPTPTAPTPGTEPPPTPEPEVPPEPVMEPPPTIPVDITLTALAAHESVGLEWNAVEGAVGYRLYLSQTPDIDTTAVAPVEVGRVTHVHRGLTDGSPWYYRVSAVLPEGESTASAEVSATPTGEWVLEELGSGLFDDVLTGAEVARVPVERRIHILLFAEGYTDADMAALHDLGAHDAARGADVDRFVDEVFPIEPYTIFREAFVVWYLPRPSAEQLGGDTAFAVPVDLSGSFAGTGTIASDGETAARAWEALAAHPLPPALFYGGFSARALNHVAYFLMFDPARGRASVSGRATSLTDPVGGGRIAAAFGVPFSHELTHSFSQLGDEYLDYNRAPSGFASETSNVVATNVCEELPWRHLLAGGSINPDVDELVGAFGRDGMGYHSELVCLLNGTHDNADFYGGSGLLRTDDRMCNFCREMTAFRVFERAGLIDPGSGIDTWASTYRAPFYDRFGFVVPAIVPQTNDVRDPASGEAHYEACVPAAP